MQPPALVLLLLLPAHVHLHLTLPSYIKTCNKDDPNLDDCVLKNGRQAIPNFINGDAKYKVPRLDPLEISELRLHETGSQNLGITMSLKDCKITGLKQAQFIASRANLSRRHIEWDFYHPYLTIVGKYDILGQVLILPIRGKGSTNITLTNMKTTFKFDFNLVRGKDGEKYMKVAKSRLDTDIGRAYFRFNNLFNGDKLLGETMNAFLNAHWKDIVKELGAPVVDSIAQVFKIILSRITGLVPFRLVYSSSNGEEVL